MPTGLSGKLARTCILLFGAILCFRLILAFVVAPRLVSFKSEPELVAESLYRLGVFGNPWRLPTGPTCAYAPAYPLLVSWIYSLFGMTVTAEAVKQVLLCAVTALQYALLPVLAAVAGIGSKPGFVAALAAGFIPVRYWVETMGGYAEPYAAVLLILACIITAYNWIHGGGTWRRAALEGVAWGLALLFTPTLATTWLALAVVGAAMLRTAGAGRTLRYYGLQFAVVVLILAPWTIRNYRVFHKVMFVRGNFGLELAVSHLDGSTVSRYENMARGHGQNIGPGAGETGSLAILQKGEAAYFEELQSRAIDAIRSHPARFWRLTLLRVAAFWAPRPDVLQEGGSRSLWKTVARVSVVWGATLLGFFGLYALWRSNRIAAVLILTIWLSFPLTYYVIQAEVRYRYPIDWSVWLAAGAGAVFLADRFRIGKTAAEGRASGVRAATSP